MLFDIENRPGGVAVARLRGQLTSAKLRNQLVDLAQRLHAAHGTALILDLSRVHGVNLSGLTALIDVFKARGPLPLAACGLPPRVTSLLEHVGLTDLIPAHPTVDDALNAPDLRRIALQGTPAVVLCAGTGSRAMPMTQDVPKPMLDIAGRPLIDHVLDHLDRCGVRDVLLNPGHLGPRISAHFAHAPRWRQAMFMVNEGRIEDGIWKAAPLGSASTLRRMHVDHSAFRRDVIVMCGDAMIDVDLAAMMRRHTSSGADVTLATQNVPRSDTGKYGIVETDTSGRVTAFQEKPLPDLAVSTQANTGVYIFSPAVFDLLGAEAGLDIANDLLPAVIRGGGKIVTFDAPFQWVDVGCGRDYFTALTRVLAGEVAYVRPTGVARRAGQWVHETARVSRRATIEGPVHIGADCVIEAGAKIVGPAMIGPRSHVMGKSLIRSSIVSQDTQVRRGALVDHMIASGHWAVDHRFADGGPQPCEPLDLVRSVHAAETPLAAAI